MPRTLGYACFLGLLVSSCGGRVAEAVAMPPADPTVDVPVGQEPATDGGVAVPSTGIDAGAAVPASEPSAIAGPRPSCASGLECDGESCCSSIAVPGGTFPMGCTQGSGCGESAMPEHSVTVSAFALDKYEVTVGRMQAFLAAHDAWRAAGHPSSGEGMHPHIPSSGWQQEYDSLLVATARDLEQKLVCSSVHTTWGNRLAGGERFPISCLTWYEALAFCIWDHGRLPTEAEWEYAAAGGSENRTYPWGEEEPDATLARFASCDGCDFSPFHGVGSLPKDRGRWGHADLAGSMGEWVLDVYDSDWYGGAGASCVDCANLTPKRLSRGRRGGSWYYNATALRVTIRGNSGAEDRLTGNGLRCATDPSRREPQ